MARHNINIQDGFLFQNLKEARTLRLSLVSGEEITGRLRRFDRFSLIVDSEGEEILVYKHAIAMVRAEPEGEEP